MKFHANMSSRIAPSIAALVAATIFSFATSPVAQGFVTDTGEIGYNDLAGPRVTFSKIVESSSTDPFDLTLPDPTGQYGQPDLNGDILSFNTPSFAARVFPGPGLDLTDGFLSLEIQAIPGVHVAQIHLQEFGSISLTSAASRSELTMVNVETPVFLTVHDVVLDDGTNDGMIFALPDPVTVAAVMKVSPDRNSPPGWDSLDDPGVPLWSGEMLLDVPEALASGGINGISPGEGEGELPIRGFSRAEYKMNNIFTALSADETSSSFIDKKGVYLNPFPTVPESGALALLMQAALLGILGVRAANKIVS